jgi:hypothetical protein
VGSTHKCRREQMLRARDRVQHFGAGAIRISSS